MSGPELVRVKRKWVPEWLWRVFCVGDLATWEPFRLLLTAKPKVETDRGDSDV